MENNTTDCKRWYVMCTKPRKEFVVFDELISKGYEAALPAKEKIFATKKGVRKVKQAIIGGYVFVCCLGIDLEKLRYTTGSTNFLHFNGKPHFLSNTDIRRLETLSCFETEVVNSVQAGTKIEIVDGILKGTVGTITEKSNQHFIYIETGINGVLVRIPRGEINYRELV